MIGRWISTEGLVLLILISTSWAKPLQRKPRQNEDSDEADSDEEEGIPSTSSTQNENFTDEELANKTSIYLTRYFSNHGTEVPLQIPTNQNHTIVITVVPNNGSSPGFGSPPRPEGNLFGYSPQQILKLQYQQILQQNKEQRFQHQKPDTPSYQPRPAYLTPIKDLVGFVPKNKLDSVISRGATEQTNLVTTSQTNLVTTSQTNLVTTSQTISTTGTSTTTTAAEPPVDIIDFDISEPISVLEGRSQKVSSSTSSPTYSIPTDLPPSSPATNFPVSNDPAVIPAVSNSNDNNVSENSSTFRPVLIQSDSQSTAKSVGTNFINFNTPAPLTDQGLPVQWQPNVIYQQPFILPPPSLNLNRIPAPKPRPTSPAINAASQIIGSLAQGHLNGVIENSINIFGDPEVQNTAQQATKVLLEDALKRLNPCNIIGGCGSRPAVLKKNGAS